VLPSRHQLADEHRRFIGVAGQDDDLRPTRCCALDVGRPSPGALTFNVEIENGQAEVALIGDALRQHLGRARILVAEDVGVEASVSVQSEER
jgi:hypothetical protein